MTNKYIKQMAEILSDILNPVERELRIKAIIEEAFLYGTCAKPIETPEGNFYDFQLENKGVSIL